jgi:2-oxo-4-hydroxy-4-carboxy-5-ureidoimidazoline decarboxylase
VTVTNVNELERDAFVAAFGGVYEHSPWVAERAFMDRPFESLADLCEKMERAMNRASTDEQLALLRVHPDLGTRAKVSESSASEQKGVGLDRLTAAEYETLTGLNNLYRAKFGFPFLYAVKGSNKDAIIAALRVRCGNTSELEFREALDQVARIARFRMEDLIG